MINPSICPWRFDLAAALGGSAPDEAREIATTGQRWADRFGAPVASGRALRAIAALSPDSAVEPLEESARILRDTGNRLEYAHTLAGLGSALIRRGHADDARAPLSTALALADECGALALRAAITQQLTSVGGTIDTRRRRSDALDPTHRRVAQLAAKGLSESEIANDMVLGLNTVTTLLREAYDRLGATSRAEVRDAIT